MLKFTPPYFRSVYSNILPGSKGVSLAINKYKKKKNAKRPEENRRTYPKGGCIINISTLTLIALDVLLCGPTQEVLHPEKSNKCSLLPPPPTAFFIFVFGCPGWPQWFATCWFGFPGRAIALAPWPLDSPFRISIMRSSGGGASYGGALASHAEWHEVRIRIRIRIHHGVGGEGF